MCESFAFPGTRVRACVRREASHLFLLIHIRRLTSTLTEQLSYRQGKPRVPENQLHSYKSHYNQG